MLKRCSRYVTHKLYGKKEARLVHWKKLSVLLNHYKNRIYFVHPLYLHGLYIGMNFCGHLNRKLRSGEHSVMVKCPFTVLQKEPRPGLSCFSLHSWRFCSCGEWAGAPQPLLWANRLKGFESCCWLLCDSSPTLKNC